MINFKKIFSILGFISLFGCESDRKPKESDHFDGNKFYNPTLDEQFSPSFSDIFRMMREGRPNWPSEIANTSTPNLNAKLDVEDISLTFINHATFLIQLPGLNILTDPVWSERVSPVSWFGPKRVRNPGLGLDELPPIDLILISHNHYDHLDIETLKELKKRFNPLVLTPFGDKKLIESIGISNVQEFDWWESIAINQNVEVTFTPTQHSSARTLFDRDKSLWGSYFIRFKSRSIYFGGDAGYSSHFTEIRQRLGSTDIALLGIGAYSPRFFMQAIHMDPAEAVLAHKDLDAKQSIGMHFGTFQLASEAFDEPITELASSLKTAGVEHSEFITLKEGETRLFPKDLHAASLIDDHATGG